MLKQLFVDLESMDSQQAAELAIEAALLMSCFSQQMTQDEASQLGLVTVLKVRQPGVAPVPFAGPCTGHMSAK